MLLLSHPVSAWNAPTSILYGGKDDLQSLAVIQQFADRFGCHINLAENSEHPFMKETDFPIVDQWLRDRL